MMNFASVSTLKVGALDLTLSIVRFWVMKEIHDDTFGGLNSILKNVILILF